MSPLIDKRKPGAWDRMVLAALLIFLFIPSNGLGAKLKGLGGVAPNPPGQDSVTYKGSYALVIGVADYDEWPDLKSVPKEMENVKTALESQGFMVTKVLNPDGEDMHQELRRFFKHYGLEKDNRLLVFFSGHGYSSPQKEEGFLVPADAPSPDLWKKNKNYTGIKKKSISMEEIKYLSKQADARHLLFVFDSCFSGSIFLKKSMPYSTSTVPPDIDVLFKNPVRQFLTAGDETQEVPGKSIFTPLFIRGISGDADQNEDEYVTGTELYLYLRKEIARYNPNQTPGEDKYSPKPGAVKGDFLFAYKEENASHLPSLEPPAFLLNRAGPALGWTRFGDVDGVSYFMAGAAYTRLFRYGNFGLALMTSLNSEEEYTTTEQKITFGRATSLSAGYTYPFDLGGGINFLLAVNYERLQVDVEVDGRADELVKNNCLLGGGIGYLHRGYFAEARLNYIIGEDKGLGHDFNALLTTGISF